MDDYNNREKTYQLYVEGLIEMEFDESKNEDEIFDTMIEAIDKSDMVFELRRSDPNSLCSSVKK